MLRANGLVKLVEECGELVQIIAKKLNYPGVDIHPDGKGSLKSRMEEEIADVQASCAYVTVSMGLDKGRISDRVVEKLNLYRGWATENEADQ